jgi:UDPglucose 6-dehydrogenase
VKISVVGAGYLGATHAICMASLGHQVIAVDIDLRKIAHFNEGTLPFYEPGLAELLSKINKSDLTFSTNFSDISECEIHFLCIGTPQSEDGLQADLSALESAFHSVV